jgi:hypothetical protein
MLKRQFCYSISHKYTPETVRRQASPNVAKSHKPFKSVDTIRGYYSLIKPD